MSIFMLLAGFIRAPLCLFLYCYSVDATPWCVKKTRREERSGVVVKYIEVTQAVYRAEPEKRGFLITHTHTRGTVALDKLLQNCALLLLRWDCLVSYFSAKEQNSGCRGVNLTLDYHVDAKIVSFGLIPFPWQLPVWVDWKMLHENSKCSRFHGMFLFPTNWKYEKILFLGKNDLLTFVFYQ